MKRKSLALLLFNFDLAASAKKKKNGLDIHIRKYKGNMNCLLLINNPQLLRATLLNIALIRNQIKARKWAFDSIENITLFLQEYVTAMPSGTGV